MNFSFKGGWRTSIRSGGDFMKFRIMPGGAKQNNSDFMNKIEAKDLILPPFPPSNIWLSSLGFLFF